MTTTIAVVGATGNLGGRIIRELLQRGAEVRAVVRHDSDKLAALAATRFKITKVDFANPADMKRALTGAACIVSALQGLRDVIVDTQSQVLDAAVAAGVPRFIPSDYSLDFTKTVEGDNRNLDFRREFHRKLDGSGIPWTSVLNGAFAELLTGQMRLIDFEKKVVSFWGSADQKLDFTTMDNIAQYTAQAALDSATPKVLRIAGDSKSARELAEVAGDVMKTKFELVQLGPIEGLAAFIKKERAADPASELQPYPRWQGAQYMHNMSSGLGKLDPLDNARYPMKWTSARDVIAAR
jgi:uncharacterized protein YbjT (DUF2867 family)